MLNWTHHRYSRYEYIRPPALNAQHEVARARYIKSSEAIAKLIRAGQDIGSQMLSEYYSALTILRLILDRYGYHMPRRKY